MLGAYKGKLMLISTWVDSAWDGKKLMDGQLPHYTGLSKQCQLTHTDEQSLISQYSYAD